MRRPGCESEQVELTGSAQVHVSRRHDDRVKAETLGALTGLAGAALGATGALVGGWLQTRYARQDRHDDRAHAAAQKTLSALIEARDAAVEYMRDPEQEDWRRTRDAMVRAETAALAIPDAQSLHDRLKELFALYNVHWWRGTATTFVRYAWRVGIATVAIENVSSYLRREKSLPALPRWIETRNQGEVEVRFRRR